MFQMTFRISWIVLLGCLLVVVAPLTADTDYQGLELHP